MRLRGAMNSARRFPWRYLFGLLFLAGIYWGVYALLRRGVRFIDTYPAIGSIADAVLQRGLEALFLVLMAGVAFSVITSAITTLYSSDDLPFLLSLPAPVTQVFYLKMFETYVTAAFLPAFFTLPVLVGLGLERAAPLIYYPLSVVAVLALYALPVALGSLLALLLMRLAPAGRVKEVATVVSVLLSAGLILGLRFLRPEQLMALSPEEFEVMLSQFAGLNVGPWPSAWAAQAVWGGLRGELSPSLFVLALVSLLLLAGAARLAAYAYREGWIRGLEAGSPRLNGGLRGAARWERLFRGRSGAVVVKDLRLTMRDAGQWSQLLLLLALAGVYLVSLNSVLVEGQRFRDAVGAMNLMFMGFLLAGVGIRLAFPVVSLEGEGFWLLKTGPLSMRQVVMAKFWGALPPMLLLGGGLGVAAAAVIDMSPTLAFVSPIAGLSAAMVITGLGIGLGAAFPRFDATNPAEVPMSPGGLAYMTLALLYAGLMTVLLAWPSWQALSSPQVFYWGSMEGRLLLLALLLLTLLATVLPLVYGARRLARYEG